VANLKANTKVVYGVQHDFYQNRYYGGNTYFHYKTNIALATYTMVMIEAIGYAYGANQSIRSSWVFYSYSYLVPYILFYLQYVLCIFYIIYPTV
jgi:hypothetical protein